MIQASRESRSPADLFLALLDRYERFIVLAGKKVRRTDPDEGRRLFGNLNDLQQKRLIHRLETEMSIFSDVLGAGENLTDSPRLVWRYLARGGYTPCSDVFDKMGDSDIIEIYGRDQIHLFQNFNFFDWISLTLERVLCETWYQNTRRDPEIERIIYAEIGRILGGEVDRTYEPDAPWHLIEEVNSEMLFSFELRVKWASPIFQKGQIAGFICVNECRGLESRIQPAFRG